MNRGNSFAVNPGWSVLMTEIQEGPRQSVTFSVEDTARPFLTANEPMWEFFEDSLGR